MENCIYCGASFDPSRGKGDHIIPSAMGEFANDIRFRRMCTSCNNKVGHSEQQLLQCGPESFFRRMVVPEKVRGNTGAMKAPPPKTIIWYEGYPLLSYPEVGNPQIVKMPDQIVVRDENGEFRHIQLSPRMQDQQLTKSLNNISKIEFLHCDEKNYEFYYSILRKIFPHMEMERLPNTPRGIHKRSGDAICKYNDHYYRALAKIAFHYYLVHSKRGYRGDERCFDAIRKFIMGEGQHEQFFQARGKLFFTQGILPDGFVKVPPYWCHLMAANERADSIVVYVSMFNGPNVYPPLFRYVFLGRLDNDIIVPDGVFGHEYIYYDEVEKQGSRDGYVKPLSLSRLW